MRKYLWPNAQTRRLPRVKIKEKSYSTSSSIKTRVIFARSRKRGLIQEENDLIFLEGLQLSGDIVTNLQYQIDQLKDSVKFLNEKFQVVEVAHTIPFTSNTTWTNETGQTLDVTVTCFGGGGGGAQYTVQRGIGAGGGGGRMTKQIITIEPGTSVPITIGKGGEGGANGANNGKTGGTTSFGTYVSASGGGGGANWQGGSGGTGGGGSCYGAVISSGSDYNEQENYTYTPGGNGGNGLYGGGGGGGGGGRLALYAEKLITAPGGNGGSGGGYGGYGGGGGACLLGNVRLHASYSGQTTLAGGSGSPKSDSTNGRVMNGQGGSITLRGAGTSTNNYSVEGTLKTYSNPGNAGTDTTSLKIDYTGRGLRGSNTDGVYTDTSGITQGVFEYEALSLGVYAKVVYTTGGGGSGGYGGNGGAGGKGGGYEGTVAGYYQTMVASGGGGGGGGYGANGGDGFVGGGGGGGYGGAGGKGGRRNGEKGDSSGESYVTAGSVKAYSGQGYGAGGAGYQGGGGGGYGTIPASAPGQINGNNGICILQYVTREIQIS